MFRHFSNSIFMKKNIISVIILFDNSTTRYFRVSFVFFKEYV